jgi:hypothetical protein
MIVGEILALERAFVVVGEAVDICVPLSPRDEILQLVDDQ